jgi:hypothetical protein
MAVRFVLLLFLALAGCGPESDFNQCDFEALKAVGPSPDLDPNTRPRHLWNNNKQDYVERCMLARGWKYKHCGDQELAGTSANCWQ